MSHQSAARFAASPLLMASSNRHKLAELTPLFASIGIQLQSAEDVGLRLPEMPEDGETIEQNAASKARAVAAATQRVSIADDTILEVAALDGRPGLRTARFAGEDATAQQNRDKLLKELRGVPDPLRTARFVCCLCIALPGSDDCLLAKGVCEGRIMQAPHGNGGFGYDSLFWVEATDCTMAALSSQGRQTVTHRARAFSQLADQLGWAHSKTTADTATRVRRR